MRRLFAFDGAMYYNNLMNNDFVSEQLALMGISGARYDILRSKDGVTVVRVYTEDGARILKCFEDIPSRREISNYRLLRESGIPTLHIYEETEAALLMEDMEGQSGYRLAEEADMADTDVARKLAAWYRKLHEAGFAYVRAHGEGMYSETELFCEENIAEVRRRSGAQGLPVWRLIEENYERIRDIIRSTPMTLTYNDFYYTNMAVARDGSSAIMFDYNLLGKGHVYSDMRNVLSSLSEEAGRAFTDAYGPYDANVEKLIDDAISPIVTLHLAYGRREFPGWARESLEHLKNGYEDDIIRLLKNDKRR